MKNYIKLIIPTILVSTSIAFAQNDVTDGEIIRENVAEYMTMEKAVNSDIRIYENTKAIYPVAFESEDKYDLNQERIIVAPSIETTFKIDTDKDSSFEREITIKYIEPENFMYNFMLTRNGLNVWCTEPGISIKEMYRVDGNNDKEKVNMLTKEGAYTIKLSNNDMFDIEVVSMK